MLVVLNMSSSDQKVGFDLASQGFPSGKAVTLLTTLSSRPKDVSLSGIALDPFAVYIGKVSK